jgi:photosystem II stability/assembly factor-like uncharacterized protein
MIRPLSIAAASTGIAALVTIACSGSSEPSTAFFRTPEQGSSSRGPTVTSQESGTTNRLQAVSAVNDRVVWASGVGGTFVLTKNGGRTWQPGVVPDAEGLEFRDVEGVSDKEAYLLAAGTGTDSRIYKTKDGGRSWTLQFQNDNPAAFYDCFDFWNPNRGITFSDPVDGRFIGIRTTNGKTWRFLPDQPDLDLTGEFGFAASGTCVATQGEKRAWIGTGGERARILATTDGGNTWTAHNTPLAGNPAGGGVFSVAFRDARHGVLGGGDFTSSEVITNFARSSDGGRTWTAPDPAPIPGAIFGLSYVPGRRGKTLVATGPGGTAWSSDEGESWSTIPDVTGFWAVDFASRDAGWAVGTTGRILKISFGNERDSGHDDDGD